MSQTIKVDKEVTIDLNTSYCNIVFDTWNKNVVEIEAYIEGEKLSKEELELYKLIKQTHSNLTEGQIVNSVKERLDSEGLI